MDTKKTPMCPTSVFDFSFLLCKIRSLLLSNTNQILPENRGFRVFSFFWLGLSSCLSRTPSRPKCLWLLVLSGPNLGKRALPVRAPFSAQGFVREFSTTVSMRYLDGENLGEGGGGVFSTCREGGRNFGANALSTKTSINS